MCLCGREFSVRFEVSAEPAKYPKIGSIYRHNLKPRTLCRTARAIHKSIIGAFNCARKKETIWLCWDISKGVCHFHLAHLLDRSSVRYFSAAHQRFVADFIRKNRKLIQSLKFKMYLWSNFGVWLLWRTVFGRMRPTHTRHVTSQIYICKREGHFWNSETLPPISNMFAFHCCEFDSGIRYVD